MTEAEILDALRDCGAMLDGHFLLSSGLHSPVYVQCALALQYPNTSAALCDALAEHWREDGVDVVIGPAMGAVTLAYELARALDARALFSERVEGKAALRRGFSIAPGERVLVCEDVLTTGGSAAEVIKEIVRPAGAEIAGVAALIDRGGAARFSALKARALLRVDAPTFDPGDCPLCREGTPAVKPGSRPHPARG